MALIAKGVLSSRIKSVGKTKEAFRDDIQEILVSCAFQAAMGNPNFANELLNEVRDTVHIKGLTLWLETFAPLVVRKEAFSINKGMAKTMHVTDEASFAPYEAEMRKVKWWEMAAPQRATSVFDPAEYSVAGLERMAKKLNDNGQPDLANVVLGFVKELSVSAPYKKVVEAQLASK